MATQDTTTTPDNVIPFPSRPTPPCVAKVMDASPPIQNNETLRVAWELVREITINDGADILALSLAIGCLAREIARLKGEGPETLR